MGKIRKHFFKKLIDPECIFLVTNSLFSHDDYPKNSGDGDGECNEPWVGLLRRNNMTSVDLRDLAKLIQ